MTKEKYSRNEIITEEHFYRKKKYPVNYLLGTNKKIHIGKAKTFQLPQSLYSSIIKSYFKSYFKMFYSSFEDLYFPLSGMLKKAKGKAVHKNIHGTIFKRSIVWIWYSRPALTFFANLQLKKTKGGNSIITKFEQDFKEEYDVELLPKLNTALALINSQNKLFKG
jgi:hypothetical protein